MVENIKEAAALANYAGFGGLGFNFERHDQFWDYDPNLPNKGQIIEQFGKNIGQAILSEFPGANILEIPSCSLVDPSTITTAQRNLNGYYYFPEFCYGLVQSRFAQFAVGDEASWYTDAAGDNPIPTYIAQWEFNIWPEIMALGFPVTQITDAEGFWPLGHPVRNPATGQYVRLPNSLVQYAKTATSNTTPATWLAYIDSTYSFVSSYAVSVPPPYAYIFDLAWSYELTPDDPFQTGPLDPNFATYINEFHAVKQKYAQ
jgi:hypothetical protein